MKLAVVIVVAGVALASGAVPARAARPLAVGTSISSQFVYLGDTVTATVTAVADRQRGVPSSLRVSATFGYWEQVAPTRTTSSSTDASVVRTWSFDIACLQLNCLAGGSPLISRLPPVAVSMQTRAGPTITVTKAWPVLSIASRFGNSTEGATPDFQLDQSLPGLRYRASPNVIVLGLAVVAVLLAAFGIALAANVILRRRAARPAEEVPALVSALAIVRRAKDKPIDDRRRAVGLLSRVLEEDGEATLADAAERAAWAAADPSPDRLEELVRTVESARGDGQ
jgi:hypothetical protein